MCYTKEKRQEGDHEEGNKTYAVAARAVLRRKRLIATVAEGDAAGTVDAVVASVKSFANGCEQFDDITALAVFYSGETVKISMESNSDAMAANAEIQEKEFEEFDTGGMGIGIVKQITEKLTYRRIGDKNILRMVFNL